MEIRAVAAIALVAGFAIGLFAGEKMYLVKRWDKSHPSGNRGKWLSGFIYYLVKDGKVLKEWDLRIPGR